MLVLDARGHGAPARGARFWPKSSATASPRTATTRRHLIRRARAPARAIRAALRGRRRGADRVRYVNSHGTGTAKNDPAETRATKPGAGRGGGPGGGEQHEVDDRPPAGSRGAVEAIVTVKAFEEQIAPPTANYTEPDPECDLDYVPNRRVRSRWRWRSPTTLPSGVRTRARCCWRAPGPPAPPPCPDYDRVVVTGIATLTSGRVQPARGLGGVCGRAPIVQEEDGARIGRVLTDRPCLSPKERSGWTGSASSRSSRRLACRRGPRGHGPEPGQRVGVMVGTGGRADGEHGDVLEPVIEEGPGAAEPGRVPNTVYNAAGGQVSIKVGAVGPASTVTAGHAAGASALTTAMTSPQEAGRRVLCIAADALTGTVIPAYQALGSCCRPARRGW